jgi:folate-binding protein YgfZ
MPDNPQHAPSHEFALPGHRIVLLEGRDAQAFTHAQFMNDVNSLADGQWQWNGWLTPKGRVIALFALLKAGAEKIGLLLPDADPEAFAAALRQYLFRSKVAIALRDDLHVAGRFSTPETARGNIMSGDPVVAAELDMGGAGGPRTLRIVAANDAVTQPPVDPGALARWAAFDLEHGLPRLPGSQAGQWTPQMLSLERLRAFSIKKGCYPGQEIVARTHFLGQAKRGLALFEADAPVGVGSEVHDDGRSIGTVVSAEANLALAVLPLERGTNAFQAGGLALRELRLLGGLAR